VYRIRRLVRRIEWLAAVLISGPEASAHRPRHFPVLAIATKKDNGMDCSEGWEDADPEDEVEENSVFGSAVEIDGQERHKDGQDDQANGDALAWLGQSDCGGGGGGGSGSGSG
jgi:hypothetical protein